MRKFKHLKSGIVGELREDYDVYGKSPLFQNFKSLVEVKLK